MCDLDRDSLTTIILAGEPRGWWDNQNIIYKDQKNNFMVFDVINNSTRMLFSAEAISNTLQKLDLPIDREGLTAFCHWNGHHNDVLFTQGKERAWGESFILKADRTNQTLKLVFRDFKFRWGGYFNSDMTLYVYEGERGQPGAGGNGSVLLRDLSNNTERTLVPADNGGQYSLPRFCDGGVIYWRKRQLWRVDIGGANNAPLIP